MSFHLRKWRSKFAAGERLVCITAYDLFTAHLAEACDPDLVLVGDSLANVVQGEATTTPVTLEQMAYHGRIVKRALPERFVVVDMPFGTFKLTVEDTVRDGARLFQQSGADGIKLEGASEVNLTAIRRLVEAGVPVMGHVGLQPQMVRVLGGYRRQGRSEDEAERIMWEAQALAEAGCFAVVLEMVDHELAARITRSLPVPTIGIGAGPGCAGQILVIHDLLGMLPGKVPSFVVKYAELLEIGREAAHRWGEDVRQGNYPPSDARGDGKALPPRKETEPAAG